MNVALTLLRQLPRAKQRLVSEMTGAHAISPAKMLRFLVAGEATTFSPAP